MPSGVEADPNDRSIRVFCASCGHSDIVHSDRGNRGCTSSGCTCKSFVVGAAPEPSAQVFPA